MKLNAKTVLPWLPERRWVLAWAVILGVNLVNTILHLYSADRALHLLQLWLTFYIGVPLFYVGLLAADERRALLDAERVRRYLQAGVKAGLYLWSLFYFLDRASAPSDPWLLQWYDSLNLYGVMIYVIWFLGVNVTAMIWSGRAAINQWLVFSVSFGWAYACLRWLLSSGVTTAQELYRTDPALFYQYCFGVITYVCLHMLTKKIRQHLLDDTAVASGSAGIAGVLIEPALTKMDKKRIACHESGHALLWAAVSPLPADISIHCFGMKNGVAGYVRGAVFPHQLPPVHVDQFRMLLDLAGKEAEWILLNEIGSECGESETSDEAKWQARAKSYLAQQTEAIFYIDPQSPAEATFNAEALAGLRRKQQALLREFMSLNRAILLRMVDELEKEGRMDNARLAVYLKDVIIPDYFPRVSW